MNRFAELLDRLVLTPSRNGKLTLLADYFRDDAGPRPRPGARRASPATSRSRAVKPAMLRALMAERHGPGAVRLFLRLCRRPRRDRSRWSGPSRRAHGDAEPRRRRWPRWSSALQTRQPLGRAEACWRGCSTRPASRRATRIIKLVTGGLRIGVSARLAKQALADFGGSDVTEIEELWHGLEPPYPTLFAWLEGGAEKPVRRRAGAVPPGDAVARRSRTPDLAQARPGATMRPSGSGTASACRRSARRACGGSIRAPATTSPAPFPISSTPSTSRARSTASCWSARRAGHGRGTLLATCSSG